MWRPPISHLVKFQRPQVVTFFFFFFLVTATRSKIGKCDDENVECRQFLWHIVFWMPKWQFSRVFHFKVHLLLTIFFLCVLYQICWNVAIYVILQHIYSALKSSFQFFFQALKKHLNFENPEKKVASGHRKYIQEFKVSKFDPVLCKTQRKQW